MLFCVLSLLLSLAAVPRCVSSFSVDLVLSHFSESPDRVRAFVDHAVGNLTLARARCAQWRATPAHSDVFFPRLASRKPGSGFTRTTWTRHWLTIPWSGRRGSCAGTGKARGDKGTGTCRLPRRAHTHAHTRARAASPHAIPLSGRFPPPTPPSIFPLFRRCSLPANIGRESYVYLTWLLDRGGEDHFLHSDFVWFSQAAPEDDVWAKRSTLMRRVSLLTPRTGMLALGLVEIARCSDGGSFTATPWFHQRELYAMATRQLCEDHWPTFMNGEFIVSRRCAKASRRSAATSTINSCAQAIAPSAT